MTIKTETYKESLARLPKIGQHITLHSQEDMVVVYQAYNHRIADFAVKNQYLGGDAFSYNRMSWIKPNFLWMMYRCGWAAKENQERVLALWLHKDDFNTILEQAAFSRFIPEYYESHDAWRKALEAKPVRLQWDPEHDPFGNKIERRAIQLGLKDAVLENFGKNYVKRIDDITVFAKEQYAFLQNNPPELLQVPIEDVYTTGNAELDRSVGI